MWEYFGPDFAFDVVKGMVAGIASMAFQVVAPRTFRAAKQFSRALGCEEGGEASCETGTLQCGGQ
ncbi:hypothetical protein ACVIYH_001424 [Bradyrhizobium diazoefficiens]